MAEETRVFNRNDFGKIGVETIKEQDLAADNLPDALKSAGLVANLDLMRMKQARQTQPPPPPLPDRSGE